MYAAEADADRLAAELVQIQRIQRRYRPRRLAYGEADVVDQPLAEPAPRAPGPAVAEVNNNPQG